MSSARDPHSILYKEQNGQKAGKIERLRAGQIPSWAKTQQQTTVDTKKGLSSNTDLATKFGKVEHNSNATSGLRFTGMTADASGVIVDTSRGQKNTDQVLEEQASK